MIRIPEVHHYKLESRFRSAMRRFGDRVIEWWGDDYGWTVVVWPE